jgi:hypothetical protein
MKRRLWKFILWLIDPFLDKSSDEFLASYYSKLTKQEKVIIWTYAGKLFRRIGKKSFAEYKKDVIRSHYFKRFPFNERK